MKKKNGIKQEVNLINLVERYHDEDNCRAYLEELRWPNGLACPRWSFCQILWKFPPSHLFDHAIAPTNSGISRRSSMPSLKVSPSNTRVIKFTPPLSGRQCLLKRSTILNTK